MPAYVALLRAVNVGGTGKLPMSDLVEMATAIGFKRPRTYIASGNLVFQSPRGEAQVRKALEEALARYAGKPVSVAVRTAAEMEAILEANPFSDRSPRFTVVMFLDAAPPTDWRQGLQAPGGEEVAVGTREFYIHFGEGMAGSKLKLPAATGGTSRNINTVAKLALMARE